MKQAPLTMLLAICAIASSAAAEPPKLDQSKPIRFEIFLAQPQFAADAPKKQVEQVRTPPIIGGWIEGGKVTGAYGVPVSEIYGAGYSPDAYSDELCPWGFWGAAHWQNGIRPPLEFRSATVKVDPTSFSGTFDLTSGTTVCQIEVSAKPGKLGYVGAYSGKFNNLAVIGTCVARPFNVPCGMVDPANALYVLETQMYKVLVEVRGGKPARATAILSKEFQKGSLRYSRYATLVAATSLHPTDASGMSVTITDTGLKGRSAALGGTITVTPVKVEGNGYDLKPQTIVLDGTIISGAGKLQSTVKDGKVAYARSWPLTDPYAGKCLEMMQGLFRGVMPLPPELASRSSSEAQWMDPLPAPTDCSRYMQGLWRKIIGGDGGGLIYAPWLSFSPVAGAVKYRFDNVLHEAKRTDPTQPTSFEASTPTASLRPMWDSIPAGSLANITVTALDANNAPIGKPQQMSVRRRPTFGGLLPKTPDLSVHQQLFERHAYHYAESYNSMLYLIEAVEANGVQFIPVSTSCGPTVEAHLARVTKDPVLRERYLASTRCELQQRLKTAFGPMKSAYHSNNQTHQMAGFHAQSHLDGLEVADQPESLVRLQGWAKYFARLQQPSGSWTFTKKGTYGFDGGFGLWGSYWYDQNSAVWLVFLSRLRSFEPDAIARINDRAMEEKAAAWFMHNSMRSGTGENLVGQTDSDTPNFHEVILIRYLEYVFAGYAPPLQSDPVMARDLLSYLEDLRVAWGPIPSVHENDDRYAMVLAQGFLEWYALTGDPLALAKSEALATGYCMNRDPVMGCVGNTYNRRESEDDEPGHGVRWMERYAQVKKTPPTAIADRHLSLTLSRVIDGADRIVLDLEMDHGNVVKALARTPTWDGPGVDHTQPGRLHTRPGKALYHGVDAKGLTLNKDTLTGEVAVTLQPPQGGTPITMRLKLKADRTAPRLWQGQWQAGQRSDALSGLTVADAVITQPVQVSVKIQEALGGGEAWQTWALAGFTLNKNGTATAPSLVNPNAGWTAITTIANTRLDEKGMQMTLNAEVAWHGVAEIESWLYPKATATYKTTPDGKEALLANWIHPIADKNRMGGVNGDLVYTTTWKQVTAGAYKLELKGERLGNLFYGIAEITAPDGKKTNRQFLGDVESVGKP